ASAGTARQNPGQPRTHARVALAGLVRADRRVRPMRLEAWLGARPGAVAGCFDRRRTADRLWALPVPTALDRAAGVGVAGGGAGCNAAVNVGGAPSPRSRASPSPQPLSRKGRGARISTG